MKTVRCSYIGDAETHKNWFSNKRNPLTGIVGSAYGSHRISMPGGLVCLETWDTATTEKHRSTIQIQARRDNVFVFFFSLVRPSTLDHVEEIWAPLVTDYPNTPRILVGVDSNLLSPENRGQWEDGMSEIPSERIEQVKNAIHAVEYVQCTSADDSTHDDLWKTIVSVGAPEMLTPAEPQPSKCAVA